MHLQFNSTRKMNDCTEPFVANLRPSTAWELAIHPQLLTSQPSTKKTDPASSQQPG